jgi:NAD(P)-dependent dehydrogenase (short-subunit alcohol dehydrogenase family)
MDDEDWDVSIRVNLRGHFMPMRAAARHWREVAKGGAEVRASVAPNKTGAAVGWSVGTGFRGLVDRQVETLTSADDVQPRG